MAERAFTAEALAALTGTRVRPVLFFEGEYDGGAARLFTGIGSVSWDGKTWLGAGDLLGISPIRESRAIEAIGFSVAISGQRSSNLATTLASMRKNKPGRLWLGFYYPDDVFAARVDGSFDSRFWTAGTTPSGYSLNEDVSGESTFQIRVGPSGANEVVNCCQSLDTPSGDPGADGGWFLGSSAFPIDKTKAYIFATWFQRLSTGLSTNGQAYFGLHSNSASDVLNLGGSSNTNPYFASGVITAFMPSADKWYLAVGYVHENGYGTTDTNISGIYDPVTGVRVVAGTEFKWPSDTTAAGHRAYHYYNETISDEVQRMTRPIVIPATVAEAPSMIQKIIRMATHHGLVAEPYPMRRGRFDTANIDRDPKTGDMTIDLLYEDRLVDLERPRERRYTHEDQQLRLAGDKGFDQVAELQDAQDVWGEGSGPASPIRVGPRGAPISR